MSDAYQLKPWTQVATPHDDILGDALEMSTYAADLGAVVRQDPHCPRVYCDARLFFEATYLTQALADLLRDAMRVLSGGSGDRVLQLRTPFGGGKTHTLIALHHLAKSRQALAGLPEIASLPDPGGCRVAVFVGTDVDPMAGRKVDGGPHLRTPWGEIAWQLGQEKAYQLVAEQDQARVAPGGDVLRKLLDGPPTLLMLDEVADYVQGALAVPLHDSTYGRQVMGFLQTLTETVRGLPNAALVYSLQASAHEAGGDEGLLSDLDHLVSRVDAKREPVSGDEVMRVIQRRLFKSLGDPELHALVAKEYAGLYQRLREGTSDTESDRREAESEASTLRERILSSYPFHPDLLDLMYHRWGSLPSYQRTRGALQFLACTVHALWHSQQVTLPLIAPGDVPLADEQTRGALFSQIGERERYTAVIDADIVGRRAGAKVVDAHVGHESPALAHLRVGTRLATAAFLYSFGARGGEDRGVLADELIASCLTPSADRFVLESALRELYEEQLLYLHRPARRYRFEPQPNLNKLIADEVKKWSGEEVSDRLKGELARRIGETSGVSLWPPDSAAIADREPRFTVVYLGPEWAERSPAELASGVRDLTENRGSVRRQYRNALAFAVPGRPPADKARAATRSLLAIESLIGHAKKLQLSDEQVDELKTRGKSLEADLNASLGKLYEAVWLPIPDRASGAPYRFEVIDLRSQVASTPALHPRVIEALRTWVFPSVTPAKLATLCNLGDDEGMTRWVACDQLVTWLFSYLDFPKLLTDDGLRHAIAEGVAKKIFGYSLCSRPVTDDAPPVEDTSRLWFGRPVEASEIDLSAEAYIVSVGTAEAFAKPAVVVQPTPGGEATPDSSPGPDQPPLQPTLIDVPAAAPGERGRRYRLHIVADKVGLFRAIPALQALSDKAQSMHVTVDVTAESTDGFDPVWLRNAVEEPLDEADVRRQAKLGR